MLPNCTVMNISPLDGRYQAQCAGLKPLTSEYGLIYYRIIVEIRWLQALSHLPELQEVPIFSPEATFFLNQIIENFSEQDAQAIKTIEATTNHDVKAIEYFLKEKLESHPELAPIKEFVHFACTSEDINNLAYGLMLKDLRESVLKPLLLMLASELQRLTNEYAYTPMLSHTHGQAASPTTVGKEMANVLYRLERQITQFSQCAILGKINGAVGNFNAHSVAYPEIAWEKMAQSFITSLDLEYNPFTTQIESHDYMAEYFHCLARINTILIDFSRDVWGYIALGYFKQNVIETETGSSTMPHKVNPIDFENAEGNFGLANALLNFFAEKLPLSRFQRDLTDSTVLRNIGVAAGHCVIGLKSLQKGLGKLAVDIVAIDQALEQNWEVLGEAIQTTMRRYQLPNPYEQLKTLTRGRKITQALLHDFIETLDLPEAVKMRLKQLTPQNYTGIAGQLAKGL